MGKSYKSGLSSPCPLESLFSSKTPLPKTTPLLWKGDCDQGSLSVRRKGIPQQEPTHKGLGYLASRPRWIQLCGGIHSPHGSRARCARKRSAHGDRGEGFGRRLLQGAPLQVSTPRSCTHRQPQVGGKWAGGDVSLPSLSAASEFPYQMQIYSGPSLPSLPCQLLLRALPRNHPRTRMPISGSAAVTPRPELTPTTSGDQRDQQSISDMDGGSPRTSNC